MFAKGELRLKDKKHKKKRKQTEKQKEKLNNLRR